jgi:potassium efflux system protein
LATLPLLLLAGGAAAQETKAPADLELTPEVVERLRTKALAEVSLDEAGRTRVTELYTEAANLLNAAAERTAAAAGFDNARTSAPDDANKIAEELATPPLDPAAGIPLEGGLPELESMLQTVETELAAAQKTFSDLLEEPAQRARRRASIPDAIVTTKQTLQELQQTDVPVVEGEHAMVAQAKRIVRATRRIATEAEVRALEAELLSYDARSGLLSKRQDLARRRLGEAEQRVKTLRQTVAARREEDARKAAEETRRALEEVLQAVPEIRSRVESVATENTRMAEERTAPGGLTQRIAETTRAVETATEELRRITTSEASLRAQVAAGGLSSAIGQLLLKYRSELPNLRKLNRDIRDRGAQIAEAELKAIQLREDRSLAGDIEALVTKAMEGLDATGTEFERNRIAKVIRTQYETRRDLIEANLGDNERHASLLNELNTKEKELVSRTQRFGDFINENVLWSRGETFRGADDLRDAYAGLRWAVDPAKWQSIGRALFADLWQSMAIYGLALAAALSCMLMYPRINRALPALGERARRQWHTTFQETLEALLYSIALALPLPVTLTFMAWRISAGADGGDLARAAGSALFAVAGLAFIMGTARVCLRPKGLFAAHFDSDAARMPKVRWTLVTVELLLLPFLFVAYLYITQIENERFSATLGRGAFMLAMLVLSGGGARLLTHYLAHQRAGDHANWVAQSTRLSYLGYVLIVGFPLVLALAAALGYYYAARVLAERFVLTLYVGFSGSVLVGLVQRWLMLAQRRLKLEQMRRERVAARAEKARAEAAQETGDAVEAELPAIDEHQLDLVRLDAQTKRLVRVGVILGLCSALYFVWAGVLPALSALDSIELSSSVVSVQETFTNADGISEIRTVERLQPITASHILTGFLIILLTIVGVRNLPGLIEIILLQRLRVGGGERYAILTIFRYLITALGIFFGFSAFGLSWSSMQWLVAAVGVGLGFGLQEIFANFVSGIILLFERPIRVGDIVTIGNVSGSVSRIQMRATTIVDWDRKELVVPNKEFVTGQLINWTLSDRILRTVIPIGIAYGSDTKNAVQVFTQIVQSHPSVLTDPAPQIQFVGFGDSSLNFEVRAFSMIENAPLVKHELHLQLDQGCRESGIEIAYPQQEIRFRDDDDSRRFHEAGRKAAHAADDEATKDPEVKPA